MRYAPKLFLSMLVLLSIIPITSCDNDNSESKDSIPAVALVDTISTEALVAHARTLEKISLDHELNRSSLSPGYLEAMDHIKSTLADSGLMIQEQTFEYRLFIETEDPVVAMDSPGPESYVLGTDFYTMTYSGIGNVTAEITFITPMFPPGEEPNASSDGCEAEDFENIDLIGKIAVIQRGTCTFWEKAVHAESMGAVAVLVFNEGQQDRTDVAAGTLGTDSTAEIPVVGISYDLGKAL